MGCTCQAQRLPRHRGEGTGSQGHWAGQLEDYCLAVGCNPWAADGGDRGQGAGQRCPLLPTRAASDTWEVLARPSPSLDLELGSPVTAAGPEPRHSGPQCLPCPSPGEGSHMRPPAWERNVPSCLSLPGQPVADWPGEPSPCLAIGLFEGGVSGPPTPPSVPSTSQGASHWGTWP